MKYVRLIFGGKVLNYEKYLTYFQSSIYWNIIECSLEDLNYTRVTKLAQESMDENCNMWTRVVGDSSRGQVTDCPISSRKWTPAPGLSLQIWPCSIKWQAYGMQQPRLGIVGGYGRKRNHILHEDNSVHSMRLYWSTLRNGAFGHFCCRTENRTTSSVFHTLSMHTTRKVAVKRSSQDILAMYLIPPHARLLKQEFKEE